MHASRSLIIDILHVNAVINFREIASTSMLAKHIYITYLCLIFLFLFTHQYQPSNHDDNYNRQYCSSGPQSSNAFKFFPFSGTSCNIHSFPSSILANIQWYAFLDSCFFVKSSIPKPDSSIFTLYNVQVNVI